MKRLSFAVFLFAIVFALSACAVISEGEYEGKVIEAGGSTLLVSITKGSLPEDEMFVDIYDAVITDLNGNEYPAKKIARGDRIVFKVKDGRTQLTAPPTLTGVTEVTVKIRPETTPAPETAETPESSTPEESSDISNETV